MYEWSDIRTFLAVMSEGSAAAAARALGTNQTTVSRRIERLEAALSLKLFEPGARGAQPTANAEALLPEAKAMEASALSLAHRAEGQRRNLTGVIRVTTIPGATRHFTGVMLAFQETHPDVRFEIDSEDEIRSLHRGEADIAVRSAAQLTGDDLIARKLIDHPWGFYASKGYIAKHGKPTSFDDMKDRHAVIYGGGFGEKIAGIGIAQRRLGEAHKHFEVTSMEVMVGLLLAGEGPGLLPRGTGDLESGLEFCFTSPELVQSVWLVWTREAEAAPHIGAFVKYCSSTVRQFVSRLPPEWNV